MIFHYFFFFFVKIIFTSSVIPVNPNERNNIKQKNNEPLFFSFSTNSFSETKNNSINFDFYEGESENTFLYVYLDVKKFEEDKSKNEFTNYYWKKNIKEKPNNYNALQVGFSSNNIETIYFIIENKSDKDKIYVFYVYDFFNMIYIEKSFSSIFNNQYQLEGDKYIYFSLKNFSKPIYFIYQLHPLKVINGVILDLIFYEDNINNPIETLESTDFQSNDIFGNFSLNANKSYFVSIHSNLNNLSYYESFIFNGFYSNIPNFVYSLDNDEGKFNISFIAKREIYYYKDISNKKLGDITKFKLIIYNIENNLLSKKPEGITIYYTNKTNFDVNNIPQINKFVSYEKEEKLIFSIKKESNDDKFIIIKLSITPTLTYEYLGYIEEQTSSMNIWVIILIIVICIFLIGVLFFLLKIFVFKKKSPSGDNKQEIILSNTASNS